jgi:chromosome segregation protein
VWRWDGYTIRAGPPPAATVRLTQRNRLLKLRDEGARADAAAAEARAAQEAAQAADRAGLAEEQTARNARRDAEQAAERRRQAATALDARAAAAERRASRPNSRRPNLRKSRRTRLWPRSAPKPRACRTSPPCAPPSS